MASEVGNPVIAPGGNQLEFNSTSISKRRYIRSPKNPLDKSTIVSIFPSPIDEVKWTIEPGKFHIDPGTFENPSILVVGSSSWWADTDIERPVLEIPTGSIQIAESIVKDFCNGMYGCNMSDAMPGLFFVLGEKTVSEIKLSYRNKLDEVKDKQNKWYQILVQQADALWARSNNNPLVIWDLMRIAARSLGLHDKSWLKDFHLIQLVPCKFCGTMRNPNFPICQTCKAIDPDHPLSKEVKFAI